ncbi:hypothetical protein CSV67_01655 [Sporosarcina sp. P2]|uniref:DUF4181 domain-containing protein n=1 Tax=Sporosarcina sp. P2 TaxID=2048251 RepID=UPI000C169AAB|nr:DUF4181 domain-containing protein [Sporosarcina sp. P2]PID04203.1 hypothetical protein CSV67_01655 [Sporosarcina sp. P2]
MNYGFFAQATTLKPLQYKIHSPFLLKSPQFNTGITYLLHPFPHKQKVFSFNPIIVLHRKIDKVMRIFSMISLITLYSVLLFYDEELLYLFFFAVMAFTILDYLIRAFFEWKYIHDPKQYTLTVTEMLIIVAAIIIVIQFNLLGPY